MYFTDSFSHQQSEVNFHEHDMLLLIIIIAVN